jgi:pimeloyl-ACP methyl ester carboxylesterase
VNAARARKDTVQSERFRVPNGAGWELSLVRTWDTERLDRKRRAVLIVPGYGMNSFIFSFHPSGLSLEGYLVDAGFETWRVDLRAQGDSVSIGGTDDFSLEDLALTDVTAAIEAVRANSRVENRDRIDVIGASLGGTLVFIQAVANPQHRMESIVSIGGPVRWVKIHPFLKTVFASPRMIGALRFKGSRKLAEFALPVLARYAPSALSIYMNPEISDVTAAREMVKTVEDPNRFVNRQIAHWFRDRDLVVRGRNISEGLATIENPVLCVVANRDGIVPAEVAAYPFDVVASKHKAILEVGDHTVAVAHADLFVSNEAHRRVFEPIARWLRDPAAAPQRLGPA